MQEIKVPGLEPVIGQLVSGLLLNAFYSAQALHLSEGKPLDDAARADLLQSVLREWMKIYKVLEDLGDYMK